MRVAAAASTAAVLALVLLVGPLLALGAADTVLLELPAVPALPADRQLRAAAPRSSSPGAYGTYGSNTFAAIDGGEPPGGYGRNLVQQAGGYGYGGYGRRLVENEDEDQQLMTADPLLIYTPYAPADGGSDAGGGDVSKKKAAAAAAASKAASLFSIPAGQCYCHFDSDFATWALGEDACKEALYARCKAEPRSLPCSWLDAYYAPAKGPGHSLPHEAAIKGFVFEDCSPAPPCGCATASLDGTDPAPIARACCRDLRVACKTPFSGVACQKVEAFCSDDKPTPVLAAWTKHVLHHSDCSSYVGMPYQFVSMQVLKALQVVHPAVQEPAAAAAEAALLQEVMQDMRQQIAGGRLSGSDASDNNGAEGSLESGSNSQQQHGLVVGLTALAAGAMCVAAVAVVFALRHEQQQEAEDAAAGAPPITSDGATAPPPPQRTAADVYSSFVVRGAPTAALRAPQPAACVDGSGSGMSFLRRDDSQGSSVIWFGGGRSSTQQNNSNGGGSSSSMREPLLLQQERELISSLSNSSDAHSAGSTADNNL